jgi:hypothetical protein
LSQVLDAGHHPTPAYATWTTTVDRRALADWSILAADWARLTDNLPTQNPDHQMALASPALGRTEGILASVWIWYHATHGDRTYNPHMRRDWTDRGRLSSTAKHVNSRWQQPVDGDGPYQLLRERLDPYQAEITRRIAAGS